MKSFDPTAPTILQIDFKKKKRVFDDKEETNETMEGFQQQQKN